MNIASTSIAVKHNIEVAHRLFELSGKCERIHGHSMWVTMELFGDVNSNGILAGIEYGDLKKTFRTYLDETYDHRLLLNASDPFARPLWTIEQQPADGSPGLLGSQVFLPGLQSMPGDPTTENIAKWIGEEMLQQLDGYGLEMLHVTVWETSVNMATYAQGFTS